MYEYVKLVVKKYYVRTLLRREIKMADDYGKIKRIGMLAYRKIRYELQYFGLNGSRS